MKKGSVDNTIHLQSRSFLLVFSLTSFMPSFTQGEISSGSSELYLKYRIAAGFKGIFDEFERLGNFIVITD